jgi:carbon storage regulator CsrA
MLVLTRKVKERIQIGDDISITVVRIKGRTVRLGIDAPSHLRVKREELPGLPESPRDIPSTSVEPILPASNEDYPRVGMAMIEPENGGPPISRTIGESQIKSEVRGPRRRFPRAELASWSYLPSHAGAPSRLAAGSAQG